jgi:hypothetical protein
MNRLPEGHSAIADRPLGHPGISILALSFTSTGTRNQSRNLHNRSIQILLPFLT